MGNLCRSGWRPFLGNLGSRIQCRERTYSVSYLVKGGLTGTGWGLNGVGAGIRAAGASLLGGLILPEELDNLSIEHALPIELDHAQLKAGTVQTDQFIAPAVSADADSIAMCGGTIPMGAHFALRPDLDISQAGLTPEGQALAKAYQNYGGYVVDAAGFTTSRHGYRGDSAADQQPAYRCRLDTQQSRDDPSCGRDRDV